MSRPRVVDRITRICPFCDKLFETTEYRNAKFCDLKCNLEYRKLKRIGKFLKNIDMNGPNGCWNWQGFINPGGYGQFKLLGTKTAYRGSYVLFNGPIPKDMYILHDCHNRACVNPDHLRAGTQQENMDDMMAANRHVPSKGSKNGSAKLNESQVVEILDMYYIENIERQKIAKLYKMSWTTVNDIIKRKLWNSVIYPPLDRNEEIS